MTNEKRARKLLKSVSTMLEPWPLTYTVDEALLAGITGALDAAERRGQRLASRLPAVRPAPAAGQYYQAIDGPYHGLLFKCDGRKHKSKTWLLFPVIKPGATLTPTTKELKTEFSLIGA